MIFTGLSELDINSANDYCLLRSRHSTLGQFVPALPEVWGSASKWKFFKKENKKKKKEKKKKEISKA